MSALYKIALQMDKNYIEQNKREYIINCRLINDKINDCVNENIKDEYFKKKEINLSTEEIRESMKSKFKESKNRVYDMYVVYDDKHFNSYCFCVFVCTVLHVLLS